jgi:hypothetical protein
LLIDYGRDAPYARSLTAIAAHRGVHPLSRPGATDLSAWVDFSALSQAVRESGAAALALGPVAQGRLLLELGIQARLQALAEVRVRGLGLRAGRGGGARAAAESAAAGAAVAGAACKAAAGGGQVAGLVVWFLTRHPSFRVWSSVFHHSAADCLGLWKPGRVGKHAALQD